MSEAAQRQDWAAMLRAFTNRNAGRRTILEIDTPDVGAQAEETDYPFWGVSFDPRDVRIQIMLGEQGSVEQHLTHSIESPASIDILSEAGRDQVLRIQHGQGQTLLRFVEHGISRPE